MFSPGPYPGRAPMWLVGPGTQTVQPLPYTEQRLISNCPALSSHFKAQLIRSIFYFLRGGSYGIKVGSVNSVVDESSHCFLLTFLQ